MRHSLLTFWLLVFAVLIQSLQAATPSLSYDGKTLSLSAENGSFGQVLELLKQQTGLEYDIPAELKSQRLALVEINGLSLKSALLKVLEGSNYDYILVATPDNPENVSKLLVTGKSTKISSTTAAAPAAATRRMQRQAVEDPFGGGSAPNYDDASNVRNDPGVNNPTENPPVQGAVPGQTVPGQPLPTQPGIQRGTGSQNMSNQNQPLQPGVQIPQQQPGQPMQQLHGQPQPGQPLQPFQSQLPLQGQSQPQQLGQPIQPMGQPIQPMGQPHVVQPFPPNNNQNNRRSPF